MSAQVERRIAAMVAVVEKDQKRIRVFSTGEQIAIALVLDRAELFPHGGYTMLEAVERLGLDWTLLRSGCNGAANECGDLSPILILHIKTRARDPKSRALRPTAPRPGTVAKAMRGLGPRLCRGPCPQRRRRKGGALR